MYKRQDRKSAKRLNEQLESFFKASHIYHIDHYLGKEMVRNIQTIRFLNPLFANVWNHECIAHVQISAMEEVGVETRGTYYDQSGALKDKMCIRDRSIIIISSHIKNKVIRCQHLIELFT